MKKTRKKSQMYLFLMSINKLNDLSFEKGHCVYVCAFYITYKYKKIKMIH